MEANTALKGNYPFDKIFNTLENVLENGIIDSDEEIQLLEIFSKFTNPEKEACSKVDLNGKVCCLTGSFNNGAKSDVEAFISCKGGICVAGLNKTVDYLIVGRQGSEAWKFGNYGGKISKAVQMQEKGSNIMILGEDILFQN